MASTARPVTSFDKKSQQILSSGGKVRGGNGILYVLGPNGTAVGEGSAEHKAMTGAPPVNLAPPVAKPPVAINRDAPVDEPLRDPITPPDQIAQATAQAPVTQMDLESDPDYTMAIARLLAESQREKAQLGADQTQTELDFYGLDRKLNERAPQLLENSTNDFAARGMLQSGGFLEDQGGIRKGIADQQADYATQKTAALSGLQRNFAAGEEDRIFSKQSALQAAAKRRAEMAANAPIAAPAPPVAAPPVAAPPKPTSIAYGDGRDPSEGISVVTPKPEAPAQPFKAPVTKVGNGANNARGVDSFDRKSQQILRGGGTVVGGDGRKFKLVNGVAAYIGV